MKLQPWQSSTLRGSLAVVGVGIILIATNPHRRAYQRYAAQQASFYLQDHACPQAPPIFDNVLQEQCNSLAEDAQPYFKPLVNLSTRRHNYILFSIYETKFSVNERLPAYSAKTVGFLNLFWTYETGVEL